MIELSEERFKAMLAEIAAEKQMRAAQMPTETEALTLLFVAYQRLKALGWRDAIYCPKDGSTFDAIEVGSTGIHPCHYSGTWPDGHWWIKDGGDLWPARPCLFRLREETER